MTPQEFRAWRRARFRSQAAAGEALGLSESTVQLYETGKRREDGRPVQIPKTVRLAMAAVSLGLRDYDGGG